MSSHEYSSPSSYNSWTDFLTTHAASTTSFFAGAWFLYIALGHLGYPVDLWVHRAVRMTLDNSPTALIRHLPGLGYSDSDSDEDKQASPRSIFSGFGSTGLLGKGVGAVSSAFVGTRQKVPAGLGNWDNSCYQNSIIQGLASLPSLREYLSKAASGENGLGADTTAVALCNMIDQLNNPENHGQHFWIKGILKSMSTFQQQDAQEYYSKILDSLDKEVKDASKSKRRSSASFLSAAKSLSESQENANEDEEKGESAEQQQSTTPNPLDGLLAQRVGCTACGYTEGLSLIPFNCLTVPLGNDDAYRIGDCLDEYTHLEYIEGVECPKCTVLKTEQTLSKLNPGPGHILHDRLLAVQQVLEDEDFDDKTVINKCKVLKKNWVKSTKSRQAVIARAPKSLVIHINRSIFDEMTGHQYKNHADILYPKVLDLGNWCLGSKPSVDQRPDDSIEEAWPRDPKQTMIGGSAAEIEDSPFRYGLRAVVTHFGNHGSGHYICYRKHPFKLKEDKAEEDDSEADIGEGGEKKEEEETTEKEQWWRLSDEAVREVSDDFVLRQSEVFMLFYERLDGDESPLPTPKALPKKQLVDEPVETGTIVNGVQIAAASSDATNADSPSEVDADASSSAAEVPLPDSSDEEPDPDLSLPSTSSSTILTPSTPTASTSASPSPTLLASVSPPALLNPASSNLTEDTELSDAETTNYDSEGAPSTQLTSDDDAEKQADLSTKGVQSGPILMRTAGDVAGASAMGDEEGKGLRAVSAS